MEFDEDKIRKMFIGREITQVEIGIRKDGTLFVNTISWQTDEGYVQSIEGSGREEDYTKIDRYEVVI